MRSFWFELRLAVARTVALSAALLLAPSAWLSCRGQPVGPGIRPQISIVAAENFYGDVAGQVAGPDARVTSILSKPDEDPHLFEVSPSVARMVSGAGIVVYNGLGYDSWMAKLLAVTPTGRRRMIAVAGLLGAKPGGNPHLWYDPATMPAYARALAADLAAIDPAHGAEYQERLGRFIASMEPVRKKVAALRRTYAGVPVTATEPVFGLMASALGLDMRNRRFQLAVMNGTEPSASEMAGIEDDLRRRRVRVLIYNSQVADTAARRLLEIARRSGVPVVGVTETEPAGDTYQQWMLGELDALGRALSRPPA